MSLPRIIIKTREHILTINFVMIIYFDLLHKKGTFNILIPHNSTRWNAITPGKKTAINLGFYTICIGNVINLSFWICYRKKKQQIEQKIKLKFSGLFTFTFIIKLIAKLLSRWKSHNYATVHADINGLLVACQAEGPNLIPACPSIFFNSRLQTDAQNVSLLWV